MAPADRPRLLDMFCGAGGAGMGYYRAGFDVVGVDIKPQPRYPFQFVLGDALEYCYKHGKEFDAIHASPPCQNYSRTKNLTNIEYPELIEQTRMNLYRTDRPYIIENVPGAPLYGPTLLCGSMFGLKTYRHRVFETSFAIPFELHAPHSADQDKLYGKNRKREYAQVVGHFADMPRACAAMGIDWMTRDELAEAIPPAYTEYIGRHLLQLVLESRNHAPAD